MNKLTIILTAAVASLLFGFFTFAETIPQIQQWSPAGVYLVPKINNVGTSTTVYYGSGANLTGISVSAIISLNGSTSSTQTFATSSDTNIGLVIGTANGVHTLTPTWIGTLADSRITSAATWNAKLSSTNPLTAGYIGMASGTPVGITNSSIFQLGANIGIGTTTPSGKVNIIIAQDYGEDGGVYINSTADAIGLHVHSSDGGASTKPIISVHGDNVLDKAIQVGMEGDTLRRLSITANGNLEFGAGGATARDTRLYRSATNTLTIDNVAGGAGNLNILGTATIGSLNGILKGTTGVVGTATNGTDFTLITAQSCPAGQHFASTTATGVFTCSADTGTGTATSSWVRNDASGYVYLATSTDSVGVGTSTPTKKLEVVGEFKVSATSTYGGNVVVNTGTVGTSTISIGQSTNPACMEMWDSDNGAYSYATFLNGYMFISDTSCL